MNDHMALHLVRNPWGHREATVREARLYLCDRLESVLSDLKKLTPPEGMALVPRSITAESGHKAGMMSEFSQLLPMLCNTCEGDGVDPGDPDEVTACNECDGAGEYVLNVNISWTTIKAIHRRIVEIAEGNQ